MSGPKVVRIVTREEIIAICEGHLLQLREAVKQWEKVGKRNNLVSDDELAKTSQRLKEAETLLSKDRFIDLQKQVPLEIEFLKADMERRIEAAAKKAADAQLRRRRIASMAAQKLEDAKRSDLALPGSLRRDLEAAASGTSDEKRAEVALAEALALTLKQDKRATLTDEQHVLAEKLRGGATPPSLTVWLDKQPSAHEDSGRKLDAALAELRMLGGIGAAAALAARQDAVLREPSEPRQRMLADTLQLDIAKAIHTLRDDIRVLSLLAGNLVELGAFNSPSTRQTVAEARAVLDRADARQAPALTKRVVDLIASERKAVATAAKRRAVLKTLAELGYEVREGMETAWVADGRLVMRRAANPETGVEVKGSDQLQFRPVRFGTAAAKSDRSKDRDIETTWCSDFDKLHKHVLAQQGELKIERAMPVGAVEVMFVAEAETADKRPSTTAPLKTRKI